MTNVYNFLLGALLGFVACKYFACKANATDEFVSLKNIRRGIANQWYTATIAIQDGKYLVRLTGKETDGDISDAYYPITEETYNALKADGVPEESTL